MNVREIRLRAGFGWSSVRGKGGERQKNLKNLRKLGKGGQICFAAPGRGFNNEKEGLQ
jgi:hypothetical protein